MNNNNTSPIASVEVVPPVPVQPSYCLTINLNFREAVALRTLCRKIGGDPSLCVSARGIFDEIHLALLRKDVPYDMDMIRLSDSINFNNWPDKYR